MKKLLFILTFAIAASAVTLQADPPIPGCPYICPDGQSGSGSAN